MNALLSTIREIIPQTPDTQTLRLNAALEYKPGQSIQVLIPGDPKKRYYSISSSPTEKDHIDITIKAEPGTPLFKSLFSLNPGSPIDIHGPLGAFTIPEGLAGPYYFLAAGSGVTPFRSMVKYVLDTQAQTEVWIFHSVKTPGDLIFKEEFLTWSNTRPHFHYVPTFTRSDIDPLHGESGRIREELLKKHLTYDQGTFFLCGLPTFVSDMEHLLGDVLKIPSERIRREQW